MLVDLKFFDHFYFLRYITYEVNQDKCQVYVRFSLVFEGLYDRSQRSCAWAMLNAVQQLNKNFCRDTDMKEYIIQCAQGLPVTYKG